MTLIGQINGFYLNSKSEITTGRIKYLNGSNGVSAIKSVHLWKTDAFWEGRRAFKEHFPDRSDTTPE